MNKSAHLLFLMTLVACSPNTEDQATALEVTDQVISTDAPATASSLADRLDNAADLPDFNTKAFSAEKYSAGNNPYKVERYAPKYFVDHAKQFEAWESKHPSAPVWSIIADGSVSTQHIIEAPEGLILLDMMHRLD